MLEGLRCVRMRDETKIDGTVSKGLRGGWMILDEGDRV